ELVVACDVDTLFVDAAEVFGPQKGATPAQVALLRRRLERLAQIYVRDYGVDVTELAGAGAAGGLAGGLAAAGAVLADGFDVVAEALSLAERIAGADLVVTGEATVDAESFEGKAVGGVVDLATEAGVPVLIVAGEVLAGELPELPASVQVISLAARFGRERARADVAGCVAEVVDVAVRDRAR
ncbi:MAG TPA: glycerate kinase, partial [Acidimicrobiales bacterium]|nr:glycerate kinase [Acidimicrobiales bacterium]